MPAKARPKTFTVDAKAILTLGRNSIKDHTTAVVELIKNAYDADADCVELVLLTNGEDAPSIRIADNGHGMTEAELENSWLRIGYSEKTEKKRTETFKRRKTGEKGIGRLSADRLGAKLRLRTRARGSPPTGVAVDWDRFDSSGIDIQKIPLEPLNSEKPVVPRRRTGGPPGLGTELIIENLRQEWTAEDVRKLYTELELLLPPYPELSDNFRLEFENDVLPELNGIIEYGKDAVGEIEFSGKLSDSGILNYRLSFRDPKNRARRKADRGRMEWAALAPDSGSHRIRGHSQVGSAQIRLSYFVRRADLLEGSGLDLTQLREYLDRNAGVKVYRDLVRVRPYGDPESPQGDWLGLADRKQRAPDAPKRSRFRVAANQIVGAVFIGRDENKELIDGSAREGLIENDAFRQLKNIVLRCIVTIEAKYHELSKAVDRAGPKAGNAKAAVRRLAGNLSTLSVQLKAVRDKVEREAGADATELLETIDGVLMEAQESVVEIEDLADQNTLYRGLATVGIASAVFGHETALAISQSRLKLANSIKFLEKVPPEIARSLDRLREADQYMDRIASWGKFALSRVRKDKRQRRRVDVGVLVTSVLDELERPMEKSGVELKRSIKAEVVARTFPMDVEAVLINFITNAYFEVKRKDSDRRIQVRLGTRKSAGREGFEISVLDSGNGIAPNHLNSIWDPLFSTKTEGSGLGLSIVKSAVEELDGLVAAEPSSSLGGAAFSAWFPRGI